MGDKGIYAIDRGGDRGKLYDKFLEKGNDNPLFLVVVKGFGKEPMMLLTSCPVNLKIQESIWRIVEIYLTRWKCDESFRYIKQCYNLEDIRVRHYTSIRNMVSLILAVAYFAAIHLGDNLKLKMLMERIYLVSKRFFGVPTFFNYAIAEGLYNLFFPDKTGIKGVQKAKRPDFQFSFSFWEECGWNKTQETPVRGRLTQRGYSPMLIESHLGFWNS